MSCGLRDVVEFERGGTPAVLVISDAFVEAADRQSEALGQPKARRVAVLHPIQDRTDQELQALARDAASRLLTMLQDSRSPDEVRT